MQKIIPHLWFDNQAEEAIKFYSSIFKNSKTSTVTKYSKAGAEVSGQAEGSTMTIKFQLEGHDFMAINAGPFFKFNPSISFFVNCENAEEVEYLYNQLIEGGMALMPIGNYGFSEKFGWVQDKFGLSWQLNTGSRPQKIEPFFLFVGQHEGQAEEAIKLYTSVFKNSNIENLARHGAGQTPEIEGHVQNAIFKLEGQEFMAMDSNHEHKFDFNEAISLMVYCDTQEEIDGYWQKLSVVPEAEQCGWLKDKFGVSWQIVPRAMDEMMADPNQEKQAKVMEAILKMKKLDLQEIEEAYKG